MPGSTFIATLPNLAEPAILAFGAGMGAFLANTANRLWRTEPETHAKRTEDGTYVGFAFALLCYVIANAAGHVV